MQPNSLRPLGPLQGAPESGGAAAPSGTTEGPGPQSGVQAAPPAADVQADDGGTTARGMFDLWQTAQALARIGNTAMADLTAVNQKGSQTVLAATTLPELAAAQMSWCMALTSATFDCWQRLGGMAWTTEASYMPEALGALDKVVSAGPAAAAAASGATPANAGAASADPFDLWMRPFNAAWGALTSPQNLH